MRNRCDQGVTAVQRREISDRFVDQTGQCLGVLRKTGANPKGLQPFQSGADGRSCVDTARQNIGAGDRQADFRRVAQEMKGRSPCRIVGGRGARRLRQQEAIERGASSVDIKKSAEFTVRRRGIASVQGGGRRRRWIKRCSC